MSSGQAPAEGAGDKPSLLQQLRANPRLPLVIGVAVAVSVLVGLLLWSRSPTYGVLYSGLSDRDGGDIIAKLDTMQVPYRFAANGSTILVPKPDIDRVRLKLAGQGLPKGGGVGFELMDKEPFGISQFAEHVNYERALEGELARSIETIGAVASARVHLAVPQSTVFVRQRKKPTASVVLKLYSGRALSHGQVDAIGHLVAASVPKLPVDAVTIVDGAGHLLTHAGGNGSGAAATQLAYVAQVEAAYEKHIRDLLAPIIGADNFRAQVAADIDFSANERTQERYAPNQKPGQATVRSQQHSENTSNGGTGVGGIPGALSNRPSPDTPSPINNPRSQKRQVQASRGRGNAGNGPSGLKMAAAAGLAADNGYPNGSSKTSSTINYEVDRTIEHVKAPRARIRRISAAVAINSAAAHSDSGDKSQPTGAPAARMTQLKNLVRGAIGYSANRGDSVEVVSLPFLQQVGEKTAPLPPWWQNRRLISLGEAMLKYLLVAIVAWLLWRRLVSPLIERTPALLPTRAGAGAPEVGVDHDGDAQARLRQERRTAHGALMNTIQDQARNDPRLVALIVKRWMNGDG